MPQDPRDNVNSIPVDEVIGFIHHFKSLTLATIDPNGFPIASYTPFINDDLNVFYVFVSGLAQHTNNMLKTKQASIMILEDEGSTKQIYARQRMLARCDVVEIPRDDERWEELLGFLRAAHGPILDTLRELSDFHLIALQPSEVTYIKGFGKAYHAVRAEHFPAKLQQLVGG